MSWMKFSSGQLRVVGIWCRAKNIWAEVIARYAREALNLPGMLGCNGAAAVCPLGDHPRSDPEGISKELLPPYNRYGAMYGL
jgi:hypothetical protein